MAIAREFEGTGWTEAQYDELIKRMDLDGRPAPGVLFHWAAITERGVKAVDVYATREQADELAAGTIAPLVAELGLTMPEIREYEVHALLAP